MRRNGSSHETTTELCKMVLLSTIECRRARAKRPLPLGSRSAALSSSGCHLIRCDILDGEHRLHLLYLQRGDVLGALVCDVLVVDGTQLPTQSNPLGLVPDVLGLEKRLHPPSCDHLFALMDLLLNLRQSRQVNTQDLQASTDLVMDLSCSSARGWGR